jgi:hypothetical protein
MEAARARKCAMRAAMVTPLALVPHVSSLSLLVALIGCAAARHQGWPANIYTLVSDYFPPHEVASVIGMCGARRRSLSCGAKRVNGFVKYLREIFLSPTVQVPGVCRYSRDIRIITETLAPRRRCSRAAFGSHRRTAHLLTGQYGHIVNYTWTIRFGGVVRQKPTIGHNASFRVPDHLCPLGTDKRIGR